MILNLYHTGVMMTQMTSPPFELEQGICIVTMVLRAIAEGKKDERLPLVSVRLEDANENSETVLQWEQWPERDGPLIPNGFQELTLKCALSVTSGSSPWSVVVAVQNRGRFLYVCPELSL